MVDKIYVHMIDGAEMWIPINALQMGKYMYKIQDDTEYQDTDSRVFFQFYPGDIVEVQDSLEELHEFKAVKLISFSSHPDRKYFNFKYLATLRRFPIYLETLKKYNEEITRIRNEISAGEFAYRGIKETIACIDANLNPNGSY